MKELKWVNFDFYRNESYLQLRSRTGKGTKGHSGFGLRYYKMPTNRLPILFFTLLNMFYLLDREQDETCILEKQLAQKCNDSINKGKRK